MGKFKFLRNRPWLLPVAWIWHLILFFAEGKVGKRLRRILRFRDTVASRSSTYKDWGL